MCLTTVLLALPLLSTVAVAEEIPINAWVHDPVISSVSISPDGNKLAAITLPALDKEPEITVWDTTNFSAPPKRFRPKDSRLMATSWLNNDRLFVVGRQKFDYRIGGKPKRWFRDKAYIVNSEGKRFRAILKNKESVGTSL